MIICCKIYFVSFIIIVVYVNHENIVTQKFPDQQ